MTPMMAKVDTTNNELSEKAIERIKLQHEKEKRMVPLVINNKITILVTPDKCNNEYKLQYMRKMNMEPESRFGGKTAHIDMDKVRELIANGHSKSAIGKMFGVSHTTIANKLKEAEMGGGK